MRIVGSGLCASSRSASNHHSPAARLSSRYSTLQIDAVAPKHEAHRAHEEKQKTG
jgi:hypothetical protein